MKPYPVFDSHCDTAYELWRRHETLDATSCCIDMEQMQQFSPCAQFFAFCTYAGMNLGYSCEQLLYEPYAYFMNQLRAHGEQMRLSISGADYHKAVSENKIAVFLSLEGAEGIACDPERLEELRSMGFTMVNLTWNANNSLAGAAAQNGDGLSEKGKVFVKEAQRLGMIIDVSHISDKAFWDIIDITEKPIVASHSNSRRLCDHCRNLTDEQFLAICQTGGYVGINLYSAFLTGKSIATYEDVFAHIDHFMELGDQNHVALGGDLDGCDHLPKGFGGYRDYKKLASLLERKGYSLEMIQNIYCNTIKEVVELCTM